MEGWSVQGVNFMIVSEKLSLMNYYKCLVHINKRIKQMNFNSHKIKLIYITSKKLHTFKNILILNTLLSLDENKLIKTDKNELIYHMI